MTVGSTLVGLIPSLGSEGELGGDPIYSIEDPMEAAALLAFAVAKIDGEVSKEEKQQLIMLFQSEFSLSLKAATELLLSCSYLYGRGDDVKNNLDKILIGALILFPLSKRNPPWTCWSK